MREALGSVILWARTSALGTVETPWHPLPYFPSSHPRVTVSVGGGSCEPTPAARPCIPPLFATGAPASGSTAPATD